MKKLLWPLGGACLALWIAAFAIIVGTKFLLPGFKPTEQQSGC